MTYSELFRPLQPYAQTARKLWKLCTLMTIGTALAATGFALVKTDRWEATQTLVLRDEAAGQLSGQGRFDSNDTLKAAQELVVEVARNAAVLEETLRTAGPTRGAQHPWPTIADVEDLRQVVQVIPPNGAEFGTTEVLHLSVTADSRNRSIQLAEHLYRQIDTALKDIRNRRAESVIRELENAEALARQDLSHATLALEEQERKVGSDLGELRSLNDTTSGDGNLRNAWNRIKEQIRDAQGELVRLEAQLQLLRTAQQHPEHLIATPNQLLDSQPALRRLKEGLVDAQLRTSTLMGRMSSDHPQVQSAQAAEQEVRVNLRQELVSAIAGVNAELQLQQARLDSIQQQEMEVRTRLDGLAAMRANYANLLADVDKCSGVLRDAHERLADARANKRAAQTTSLLTRFDSPVTGQFPLGPSRSMIVAAGLAGGFAVSGGLVVLLTPGSNPQARRWTDRLWGRRSTDSQAPSVSGDRRGAAEPNPAVHAGPGRRSTDASPPVTTQDGRERRSGRDRRGQSGNDDRRGISARTAQTELPVGEAPGNPSDQV